MTIRLAINGYGRIGRCVLRALYESAHRQEMQIVAINEPADLDSIAYLTRFDSTHGRFPFPVEAAGNNLLVDGQSIPVFHSYTSQGVPWRDLDVDVLLECSGQYAQRDELQAFLDGGCRRVLLSQPGDSAEEVDATVVYGINQQDLSGTERIVSAASCTTNAAVPVLSVLHQAFGVEGVLLTTLHSVMNDQPLIDGYHHADLRRTRSAMQSLVPVSTGLARGVERLMPQLAGLVQAKAIRVPVLNVSAMELVLTLARDADVAQINASLADACRQYPGLLAYSDEPHASTDFNHSTYSAIVDGGQTQVVGGQMVSLLIWFDNEWGYVNRMLDLAACWCKK